MVAFLWGHALREDRGPHIQENLLGVFSIDKDEVGSFDKRWPLKHIGASVPIT